MLALESKTLYIGELNPNDIRLIVCLSIYPFPGLFKTPDFFTMDMIPDKKSTISTSAHISEALLGLNSDKRHGLEPATCEPRTGDDRQTIPTN